MSKIVDLKTSKKKREDENYKALVLKIYDEMEHADKRAQLDKKAEVQIRARERL